MQCSTRLSHVPTDEKYTAIASSVKGRSEDDQAFFFFLIPKRDINHCYSAQIRRNDF